MTDTQYRNIMQHVHELMIEHDLDELIVHRRVKQRRTGGKLKSRLSITHFHEGVIVQPVFDGEQVEDKP